MVDWLGGLIHYAATVVIAVIGWLTYLKQSPMLTVQRPEGNYESPGDVLMSQFQQTEHDIHDLKNAVNNLKNVLSDQYWALSAKGAIKTKNFIKKKSSRI